MRKVQGIVMGLNPKLFGIKLDTMEKWVNVKEEKVQRFYKDLSKGDSVELSLKDDKNEVLFMRKTSSNGSPQVPVMRDLSKESYWEEKNERDKIVMVRISWSDAFNKAIELFKIKADKNELPEFNLDNVEVVAEEVHKRLAAKCETK